MIVDNKKMSKKIFFIVLVLILNSFVSFVLAYLQIKKENLNDIPLLKPKITAEQTKTLPLLQYSITNLAKKEFSAQQPIKVKKILSQNLANNSYVLLFTYISQGKNISGALNLQITASKENKATVIMLRGFAPLENYYSGLGTKNAAAVLAENNYLTLAPDFLGYSESDSEPSNTWEARFIKVVNVIDLIKTIQQFPEIDLSQIEKLAGQKITVDTKRIGLWGHSNGGQIAVSTLEVLGSNLPTTLWAPVLAPFPYSILYFTDENADEGKEARKYLAQFEEDYDVFDFSISQHLDRLNGPIQIQHGNNDDSALISWTKEFLSKVDLENEKRATASSESADKKKIEIEFHQYPGANHNLQPNWAEAIQKDLNFFAKTLMIK